MEEDFFFNVECGFDVFTNTDWLSPKINVGPSTGIPIIRNLYQRPRTYSQQLFIATNSDLNEEVSTLVCFFENQYIGAEFKNIKNPVLERRVVTSPAWSESTKALILNEIPRGGGMLGGNSSLHSP